MIEVLLEYYDAVFLKAQVASFSQGHYYWLLELPLLVPLSVVNDKQYGIIKSQLLNKSPRGISICIWSRVALPGVSISLRKYSLSYFNIFSIHTFWYSWTDLQAVKMSRPGTLRLPILSFLVIVFSNSKRNLHFGSKKSFFFCFCCLWSAFPRPWWSELIRVVPFEEQITHSLKKFIISLSFYESNKWNVQQTLQSTGKLFDENKCTKLVHKLLN